MVSGFCCLSYFNFYYIKVIVVIKYKLVSRFFSLCFQFSLSLSLSLSSFSMHACVRDAVVVRVELARWNFHRHDARIISDRAYAR